MSPLLLALAGLVPGSKALDNGLVVPPMGWSSWYGFTQNINDTMLRDMADGMVNTGLRDVGYEHIWLDDGWAVARDNKTGRIIEDAELFPKGMGDLVSYVHGRGLKFGIYTSKGPLTCLGYQPTQPDRPGSCGYEKIDAQVYAEWKVDQVKDDGCGQCPQHDPWVAMRDALNATGRPMWFAIHPAAGADPEYPNVSNMWRVGGDLCSSSYDMWTNRLDLATNDSQAALAGPGSFPNPDFLEVGYSPRAPRGNPHVMTPIEQRSMFTMWAALPGPLILSADLRQGAPSGGIYDAYTMATLKNTEVIAVNQDPAAKPMRPIRRAAGIEVWRKPLSDTKACAIVLFNRNTTATQTVAVSWQELGWDPRTKVTVRDLWASKTLGDFSGSFNASVVVHEARIYKFVQV